LGIPDKPKEIIPREQKWQKHGKETSTQREKVEYKIVTADEVLEQKQLKVRPDAG